METSKMMEVQSYIFNMSFPRTLTYLLNLIKEEGALNIEYLITEKDDYCWTAPKWAKAGDVVFFMHSKSSLQTIRRLKKELNDCRDVYSPGDYLIISEALERGERWYNRFGGKIFLVAQVAGKPFKEKPLDYDDNPQWKIRTYAYLTGEKLLENPIELEEFNDFIKLSCGGTITPVYCKEFEKLKNLIKSKNHIPDYLENSKSMAIPLAQIDKTNWIQIASKFRMSFIYESQFRAYYVDYFLRELGDKKTFYRECRCEKKGNYKSWVDNVIIFEKKYLPVEVKLSIKAEDDIKTQVRKYCKLDGLILNAKEKKTAIISRVIDNYVLIIDTFGIYLYDFDKNNIVDICNLDDISKVEDIHALRKDIIKII